MYVEWKVCRVWHSSVWCQCVCFWKHILLSLSWRPLNSRSFCGAVKVSRVSQAHHSPSVPLNQSRISCCNPVTSRPASTLPVMKRHHFARAHSHSYLWELSRLGGINNRVVGTWSSGLAPECMRSLKPTTLDMTRRCGPLPKQPDSLDVDLVLLLSFFRIPCWPAFFSSTIIICSSFMMQPYSVEDVLPHFFIIRF